MHRRISSIYKLGDGPLHDKAPKPIALPLQNELLRLSENNPHFDLRRDDPEVPSEEEEPDAVPEYY